MFGILLGMVCLFGLLAMTRSRRHRHAHCHAGRGMHHAHHSQRGRGRGRGRARGFDRAMGEAVKRGLHVDRDQENLVDHALKDLREALRSFKDTMRESRADVAEAFDADTVDDAALDVIFANQDAAITETRRQVVSALKQVHAVLDDDQRAKAVTWLASGPTWRR